MKNLKFIYILACTFFLSPSLSYTQEKRDYIWVLGDTPNNPATNEGGSLIDFNFTPPLISSFNIPFSLLTISMISDSSGELLFYTNGCSVANKEHLIMLDGDSLNSGTFYTNWCINYDLGYPSQQGALTLPWPGDENLYIIFHLQLSDAYPHNFSKLLYSLVDMSLDNGNGGVIHKNEVLLETSWFADNLTAVRHANGRDWWIILPKFNSNQYYKFLLGPDGLSGPFTLEFGIEWNDIIGQSQACFSPNGAKYIRMAPISGLQIADFDRCSGEFTNNVNITFPNDTIYLGGCAVSPNNRFLYISAYKKVFQFDLEANDIGASKVLLATWDGTQAPFSANFFQSMLVPDGKIYMTTANGTWVLHVVHNPDEKGLACNFEQHDIYLPTKHSFSVPNFPYFRLYDQPGSACDTLGISGTGIRRPVEGSFRVSGLRIFPSPAFTGSEIRVETGCAIGMNDHLEIYDLKGSSVIKVPLTTGISHFNFTANELPPGIYTLILKGPVILQSGHIIIMPAK